MDKSKLMMIVIISLLVLLLATIGVVSVVAINRLGSLTSQLESEGNGSNPGRTDKLTADKVREFSLTDPIPTNLLTGSDGVEHVIRISVTLGINDTDTKKADEIVTMFTDKERILRDLIITVLRDTTYQDLKRPDGFDLMKETLLTRIQEEFNTTMVVSIYFDDVIFQ